MTKRTDQPVGEYLAPGEAARTAFVSSKTLSRLADEGSIRAMRLPSGHRRYLTEDIESLKAGTLTVPYTPRSQAASA